MVYIYGYTLIDTTRYTYSRKTGTPDRGDSLMLPVHTIESEFLTNQVKLRPVLLLVLGLCFVLAFGFSKAGSCPPTYARWIYTFFNRRQFYDKIMNDLLSYPLFRFGFGVTTSLIDKGLIEVLVPVGCTNRRGSSRV